jgi:hypothetical protein
VQQRRLDRGGIELPLGEDLGDRDRVRDVRLAAAPELAEVGGVAEAEGLLDVRDVGRRQVLPQPLGQVGEADDDLRLGDAVLRRRVDAPDRLPQRRGGAAQPSGAGWRVAASRQVRRGGRRGSHRSRDPPTLR